MGRLRSAVGQADDFPTGFGQDWDGHGKRFGSSMSLAGVLREGPPRAPADRRTQPAAGEEASFPFQCAHLSERRRS